jgi:hypothetical protein
MRIRQMVAMAVGVLMATLSVAGVGQAQGVTAVQGTIQAVDCQSNSLVLTTSDGATHVFPGGPYTAVFVNGTPVSLCALQQYVGSSATVTVGASGNQLVAQRIDVYAGAAQPAPAYPAPAPAPAPAPGYTGVPSWLGVAIGAAVVGGLLYLLIRGHDGHEYRYPYNGYYHGGYYNGRYYQPGYYNGGRYYGQGIPYGPRPGYAPQCSGPWQLNCREGNNGN